jgi:phosphoribosylformimino-5-aminoimidazole carboxamide ribotide isomerase
MQIFPAIDLRNGQVVRLTQGDYEQMTVYAQDPVQMAAQFIAEGAQNLHIVDLDGAKDGRLVNFQSIQKIMTQGGLFVQVGGGIRDEERISQYLDLGVDRVILGTVAVKDFTFLQRMVDKYKEKIAVGVDAKDGFVAINGWQEVTDIPSLQFCQKLADIGVQTVIYTDIAKDGGLAGTNLQIYDSLRQIDLDIVASGGISFEEEIVQLKQMDIYAAIVGKAIYTDTLNLRRIIEMAK